MRFDRRVIVRSQTNSFRNEQSGNGATQWNITMSNMLNSVELQSHEAYHNCAAVEVEASSGWHAPAVAAVKNSSGMPFDAFGVDKHALASVTTCGEINRDGLLR